VSQRHAMSAKIWRHLAMSATCGAKLFLLPGPVNVNNPTVNNDNTMRTKQDASATMI